MNWGFHFHILGPRARAYQDPKDFREPSKVFNPQWAQFLRWLWCPHTQAWTVSVTVTWATPTPGLGGESCKWSYGWERRGNQLSELDGWTAPALAPPTLTTTYIPMSPLTRTRSEEPIDAVGRHHAHGSQADGSRERIAVLVHVVGTEVFCPGHWRLHIDGGQGWDSNELSHQQQFWFTQRLRGSATHSVSLGTFHFLLKERQALHVLACGSVTHSHKCDLN